LVKVAAGFWFAGVIGDVAVATSAVARPDLSWRKRTSGPTLGFIASSAVVARPLVTVDSFAGTRMRA
jgi:hypothetical protein